MCTGKVGAGVDDLPLLDLVLYNSWDSSSMCMCSMCFRCHLGWWGKVTM